MPTGIELSSGVVVGAPKALDAKYGPYASVTLALADLPPAIRFEGLTVGIVNGSTIDEYWFQGGVTNSNFVIKREVLSFPRVLDFPNSGTSGIIYIAQDSDKLYRWIGTAYVELAVSTNADWNSTVGASQIFNKPTIPSVPVLASEQTLGNSSPPYENLIRLGQHSIYRFFISSAISRGVSFGSGQAGDLVQIIFSDSSNTSSTLLVARSDGFGNAVNLAILNPGTSLYFYNPTGVNTAWVPLQTQVDWNIGSGPNSIRNKPVTFPPTAHSHAISDVTGLQTALDNRATLESGKVPSSQLPSYVDDVEEYATLTALQAVSGETSKIYVVLDTNKVYRWSGSAYVEISSTPTIGTTAGTVAAGNHTHLALNITDLVSNAGPSFIYRFGGTGTGQLFENSGFVGPTNVGLTDSLANGSPVGGYGFYGGWDNLEHTRLWIVPSQLFPHCNRFRIRALTKCASRFNDGVWTMVRFLSAAGAQTTVPGLQAFGGSSNQTNHLNGIYVGVSNDFVVSDFQSPITFLAYFAAYNGGNGGSISQCQIILQGFNV